MKMVQSLFKSEENKVTPFKSHDLALTQSDTFKSRDPALGQVSPAGVWGQEEEAQMEREEGSLGRTLERKGIGMSTAHPPKCRFYMLHVHNHQPRFSDANTHTGLQLEN